MELTRPPAARQSARVTLQTHGSRAILRQRDGVGLKRRRSTEGRGQRGCGSISCRAVWAPRSITELTTPLDFSMQRYCCPDPRRDQVRPGEIKSDHERPSQTSPKERSSQTTRDQVRPVPRRDQVRPRETKSDQAKERSSQTGHERLSQTTRDQVRPRETKSDHER